MSLQEFFVAAGTFGGPGQIRTWRSIAADGSLSLDSFRAGQVLMKAESGQFLPPALQ
jgi:hypothetical protein